MRLIYEGKDITQYADVRKCVHRDVSFGRSDSLELELEHAAIWHSWNPQQDDRLQVMHDGYDTGSLYLNTILPEKGRYRILATSLPSAAWRKNLAGV